MLIATLYCTWLLAWYELGLFVSNSPGGYHFFSEVGIRLEFVGFSEVVPVPVRDGFFETPRRTPPPRESLHAVTMHVSACFGRDERPPTSGVSPIRREHRTHVRGWGLRPSEPRS